MDHRLARRFGPLIALVVAQLLIIGLVPSKAQRDQTLGSATMNAGPLSTEAGGGEIPRGSANPSAPVDSVPGAASDGGVSNSSASAKVTAAANDTSHCVSGRTFDPNIAYWAAPCVAGTPGAPYAANGGSTHQGVTSDKITIVDYISNFGAEVNAVLAAQGLLVTYQDAQVIDRAWEHFINSHYVLYGRHVKIITYQGQCQLVPPDYACLIAEMDSVVGKYHPLAMHWFVAGCSACFAELARLKVIGFGAASFSDALTNQLAPYFFGAGQSSTNMSRNFAGWWCKQMSSRNVPSRTVRFAGHQNPAQDFNGRPRELGIIAPNDPDNKGNVQRFLVPLLKDQCGERVTHFYFYDQDINTAAKQAAAEVAAMNTATDPATSVLCLCDPVAPAVFYGAEQSNNYYPEHLIATETWMDLDTAGQSYGPSRSGGPSLACPSPQRGCEYDLALGLATNGPSEPQSTGAGLRVFRAGGGSALPSGVTPANATLIAAEWVMAANLIQAAGPDLTPEQIAARSSSLGRLGGAPTHNPLLTFQGSPKGSGYWTKDAQLVFWSRDRRSRYNNEPGTYVQVGPRTVAGGWQSRPDGPDVPLQRG